MSVLFWCTSTAVSNLTTQMLGSLWFPANVDGPRSQGGRKSEGVSESFLCCTGCGTKAWKPETLTLSYSQTKKFGGSTPVINVVGVLYLEGRVSPSGSHRSVTSEMYLTAGGRDSGGWWERKWARDRRKFRGCTGKNPGNVHERHPTLQKECLGSRDPQKQLQGKNHSGRDWWTEIQRGVVDRP